mgnify:CR=1 FL=1
MRTGEVSSAFPEIFLVLIIIASVKPTVTGWARVFEDLLGIEIVRLGLVDYLVLALALAIFSWFGIFNSGRKRSVYFDSGSHG